MEPKSWIDGSPVTRFRLSNNRDWATEFEAFSREEFEREFIAALRRATCLVSLHSFESGYWLNVGGVQMGVFYDARGTLQHSIPGRYETRGNGHDFLCVSPDAPCVDVVWAIACRQPPPRQLPHVECRSLERLESEDQALGLEITHRTMTNRLDDVLTAARERPHNYNRVRDAVARYRADAERFVSQGHTRGTLPEAMAVLMRRTARELRMSVAEMLAHMHGALFV